MLAITALLSTAYVMYFMPPTKPDTKGKRPAYIAEKEQVGRPIRKYMLWMSAAVCGVLAIKGISVARKLGDDRSWLADSRIWRCFLPSGKSLLPPLHEDTRHHC